MVASDSETELVDALLRACEEGSEAVREAGYAAQSSSDFSLATTREATAGYVQACTSFRISVTLAALALQESWRSHDPSPDLIRQLPAVRSLIATTAGVDPAAMRAELDLRRAQVDRTSERLRSVADNEGADELAVDLSADLADLETTCGTIVKAAVGLWAAHQELSVQARLDTFSSGR